MLGFALVGGAITVGAVAVALVVAKGEARGHAFFHLIFGGAALTLFATVGFLWRPSGDKSSPKSRRVLLAALGAFAAASLFEALGAAGYDQLNDGHRIEWLTTIHGIASAISGVGFLVVLIAAPAAAVSLVTGWSRGRRARAEGTPSSRHSS